MILEGATVSERTSLTACDKGGRTRFRLRVVVGAARSKSLSSSSLSRLLSDSLSCAMGEAFRVRREV